jgi:hypothetical protein
MPATMRTIAEAIKFIKERDKQTALTKNALRNLVLSKRVASCRIGSKYLINMTKLEEFLNGDTIETSTGEGEIRQLDEKLEQLR